MANSVTRTLILEETARRGWRTQSIGPNARFLKIIHPDGRWEMVSGTNSTRSSAIGIQISGNKDLTMDFIKSYGYLLPEYALVASEEAVIKFLQANETIVLKPTDSSQTKGVTVGVTTEEGARQAFQYARSFSNSDNVIAQKHLEGKLYRLVILDGTLIAAIERQPASVVGDGISTIRQLITQVNQNPERGDSLHAPLSPINLTAATEFLGEDMERVLPANDATTVVAINMIGNGGRSVAVLESVHPDWRTFTERIATETKLFISGFDVICDDISQPLSNNYVPLLEINAAPALRFHEYPSEGEPVHIAPLLLDALFPDN